MGEQATERRWVCLGCGKPWTTGLPPTMDDCCECGDDRWVYREVGEPVVTIGSYIQQMFPQHERAFREAVAGAFADRPADGKSGDGVLRGMNRHAVLADEFIRVDPPAEAGS